MRVVLLVLVLIPYELFGGLTFENYTKKIELTEDIPSEDFTFCYKNTGKYPVKIIATRTSCGCTILTDIKRNISPGESGEVNGKFVSNGVVGEQERDIYIQTDDVSNEEIKLNLKINITSNVIITPKILVWDKDKLSTKTLKILLSEKVTHISNFECKDKGFLYTLKKISKGELMLSITPTDAQKKRTLLTFTAEFTNLKKDYNIFLLIK